MSRKSPFEKDVNPKENLESLTNLFIFIIIVMLILLGIYFLAEVLYNPIYTLLSIIGNTIINVTNYITPIPSVIIILLIAAAISKLGTFLEDENDIKLYEKTIYFFWFMDIITLFAIIITYAFSSIPIHLLVGIGFTLFIAPPFVFLIMKGLCELLGLIIADACHNPFNG